MMRARQIIERCRALAGLSETSGGLRRTFLSPPMRELHRLIRMWMEAAGMRVWIDAAGNVRGVYEGAPDPARRLLLGSHVDTVPDAGAFDGVLGVVLAIDLVESLGGRRLPFAIEVAAFSEEEGVRFGVPFIGSRALTGTVDAALLERRDAAGISVEEAIHGFGLDPVNLPEAKLDDAVFAFVEFHIEQGPVLESLGTAARCGDIDRRAESVDGHVPWASTPCGHDPHAFTLRRARGGGTLDIGGGAPCALHTRPRGNGGRGRSTSRRGKCYPRRSAREPRRAASGGRREAAAQWSIW